MPVDTRSVTVVIPTRNRKESLGRCLSALFGCATDDLCVHVVVVDDGSSDGTSETVALLAASCPAGFCVEYLRTEGRGAAAARNLGSRSAKTELILFLDDDCVPEQDWVLAMACGPWEEGVGAAAGWIISAERGNCVERYCRFLRFNEYPVGDSTAADAVFVNTANCAYLRRALEEVGGFEELFSGAGGEDHDLSWRIQLRGYEIRYRQEAKVRHHHREDLRELVRAFWSRGSASALLRCLWDAGSCPDTRRVFHEAVSLLPRFLGLALLPIRAVRLAYEGAPARDCLTFAFLEWLQRAARHCGRITMLVRLLRGRQSLQRTATIPRGNPPRIPPRWARSSAQASTAPLPLPRRHPDLRVQPAPGGKAVVGS